MLYENLPLSFPWYPTIRLQDRFRQNVAVDPIILQLSPNDGLLPFQIRKNATSEFPTTFVVKCCALDATLLDYDGGYIDTVVADMSPSILECFLTDTLDGMDVLTFIHKFNDTVDPLMTARSGMGPLPAGAYYLEAQFSDALWVSELFRVPHDGFDRDQPQFDCNYIRLQWYHGSDIAPIHYTGDPANLFYNLLYLDTFITASEPTFELTGERDGKNELIATFQKAIIKYRLSAVVPDFIKIALYLMPMHDNKHLCSEKKIREGDLKNVEVSAQITNDGAYSTVEILFEQMVIISNTSCINNMSSPLGYEMGGGPWTLVVHTCPDDGHIHVQITTGTFPGSVFGELWGQHGAGAFVLLEPYITIHDLHVGISFDIDPVPAYDHFKVIFRTFGIADVGESTVAAQIADLC